MKHLVVLLLTIFFAASPALAAKKKVAIGTIKYCASGSSQSASYAAHTEAAKKGTEAFKNMLITAMAKTRKLDVVEFDDIVAFKGKHLSESNLLAKLQGGKGTDLKGIDYVATVSITEFGELSETMKIIAFTTQKQVAAMAVDIRIIEVKTGSIVVAETVRKQRESKGTLVLDNANTHDDKQSVILGEVMRVCANNAANLAVTTIYPIKVVAKTNKSEVMLNYGEVLLRKGHRLGIYKQGDVFRDPDTGEELGCEEKLISEIEVTSTHPKFSKAKIIASNGSVSKGMIARIIPHKDLTKEKSKTN